MPVEAKPLFRPDVLRRHLDQFSMPADGDDRLSLRDTGSKNRCYPTGVSRNAAIRARRRAIRAGTI